MNKVSICITTYNRGASLSKTLDSILNQSFNDFELIISDDNSTDNTRQICEKYVQADRRVKYFRNEINLKMPGNLNNAISKASGSFIANLHDGDIYRTDLIEKWYKLLVKYPEALFVFNQYEMLDKNGNKIQLIDHHLAEVNDGNCLSEYFYRNFSSAPWGTVMARKEAYENFGLFDNTYEFISDVEMWLRLGSHGKVCYVNEPLIELTPRETTHKYFLPYWRITFLNLAILYRYYNIDTADVSKKIILRTVKKHLWRSILILFKHLSFTRAREYLYLVYTSPFTGLKLLITPLCIFIPLKPAGFVKNEWRRICRL